MRFLFSRTRKSICMGFHEVLPRALLYASKGTHPLYARGAKIKSSRNITNKRQPAHSRLIALITISTAIWPTMPARSAVEQLSWDAVPHCMQSGPPAALRLLASPCPAEYCAQTVRWEQDKWRMKVKESKLSMTSMKSTVAFGQERLGWSPCQNALLTPSTDPA